MHFLETKEGTGQTRRSKRIQEIEAKKEVELQQLQNEKNSVDKKSVTPSYNNKNAHRCRGRSKSVASERSSTGPKRRPLVDVNSSDTPPKSGRRCYSRSKSTACERNTKLPSNVPARRSLIDSTIAPSSPKSTHRCNRRSKSASFDSHMPSSSNDTFNTPAKSSFKCAHRCFNRSKSVAFEVDRSSNASASQSLVISDVPIDLSVQIPAAHQSISVPNAAGTNLPNVSSIKSSAQLASDIQLAYENRIENLVQSNFGKINRIKELIAENRTWREQVDTLNRINQSLAATVDAFVAESNPSDSVSEAAAQNAKFKNEIEYLRGRVNRLNRENFDLRSTNESLKSSLDTHSKQILGEHNYNL